MVAEATGQRRVLISISVDALVWALAALAVVGGLAARIAIAWRPVETLVTKVLPDDAFYYFVTADRIAAGQGITFDGFTTSNGYHPLWLFSLVPIYLLPGREVTLHIALTFASVLDVCAGVFVGLAAYRLTKNRVAGLFALCVYLFLPQNIFAAVNGVESALTCFMLAALLLAISTLWLAPRDDWLRPALATGTLCGLTVLSRLDSFVAVGGALLAVALLQQGANRWRAPLVAGSVAAVMVLPWLAWGAVAAGGATPVSSEATPWLLHELYAWGHPDASALDRAQHGWDVTKGVLRRQLPGLYLPDSRALTALILAGLSAAVAHALLVARSEDGRRTWRALAVPALPFAGFAAMLFASSFFRWSVREWYFAWGMPAAVLSLAVLFDHAQRALARRWERSAAAVPAYAQGLLLFGALGLFLTLVYVGPARDTWRRGHTPFQGDNLTAGRYLKQHTEPGARIATFNAGVISYFSERSVVNIDGVVNRDALDAMQDHRLLAYLRSAGVDYAADRDGAWTTLPVFIRPDDWSQSLWGEDPNLAFEEVAQISQQVGFFPPMRVWRLER